MEHLYEVNPGRSLMLPEKFGELKERLWAFTGDYIDLSNPLLRSWMKSQMGKVTRRHVLPKGKAVRQVENPAAARLLREAVAEPAPVTEPAKKESKPSTDRRPLQPKSGDSADVIPSSAKSDGATKKEDKTK